MCPDLRNTILKAGIDLITVATYTVTNPFIVGW
jgi:hypothetical protein